MIASEDAVKHAILALAGAYVLDYVFKDDLRNRTNAHYRKASELISAALKRPEVHTVGEGDGIVAAILLLVVDDVCASPSPLSCIEANELAQVRELGNPAPER
jgi:hypothetical protein